jgi:hypothetical protein
MQENIKDYCCSALYFVVTSANAGVYINHRVVYDYVLYIILEAGIYVSPVVLLHLAVLLFLSYIYIVT